MNKRNQFNTLDASKGSVLFVVLQNLFIVLLTALVYGGFRYSEAAGYAITGLLELTFFLTVVIVCSISGINIWHASKLNIKPTLAQSLIAIAVCFICLYGFSNITNAFYYLIRTVGYSSDMSEMVAAGIPELLIEIVGICVLPAFCEEILFRGLICNGLKDLGMWPAILISSTFFMLMHGNPDQTVYQWLLGVVLGYMLFITGSLWVPIIIHFCNNFFITILNFIASGSQNETSGGAEQVLNGYEILDLFYVGVIFALVAALIIYYIGKYLKKHSKHTMMENKTIATVDGQSVEAVLENVPLEIKEVKTKAKMPKSSKMLMILSLAFLIGTWILAFVEGLA